MDFPCSTVARVGSGSISPWSSSSSPGFTTSTTTSQVATLAVAYVCRVILMYAARAAAGPINPLCVYKISLTSRERSFSACPPGQTPVFRSLARPSIRWSVMKNYRSRFCSVEKTLVSLSQPVTGFPMGKNDSFGKYILATTTRDMRPRRVSA